MRNPKPGISATHPSTAVQPSESMMKVSKSGSRSETSAFTKSSMEGLFCNMPERETRGVNSSRYCSSHSQVSAPWNIFYDAWQLYNSTSFLMSNYDLNDFSSFYLTGQSERWRGVYGNMSVSCTQGYWIQ